MTTVPTQLADTVELPAGTPIHLPGCWRSRHRREAGPVVCVSPDPVTHEGLLSAQREYTLSHPLCAAGSIQDLLAGSLPFSTAAAVDLQLLRAEALCRAGWTHAALIASMAAATTAASAQPPDPARLALALLINADIWLCGGDDRAIVPCRIAVEHLSALPNRDLLRHAQARHALAVYYLDPDQGQQNLRDLLRQVPGTPQQTMLAAADITMTARRPPQRVSRILGKPPPMSGGLLHPAYHQPDPDELAYRLRTFDPMYGPILGASVDDWWWQS